MKETKNLEAIDKFLEKLIEVQSKFGEDVEIATNFTGIKQGEKIALMRGNYEVLTIEASEPALILTGNFGPKINNKKVPFK